MARSSRLLAIGWFGERNLGDEAMLSGLLALATRALGPLETTVVTADPPATAATHGVRTLRQTRPEAFGFRNPDLVRAALRADLVTLGGGDLIREAADGQAPALNWLRRLRVPLALRRRVALIGVSVGELVRPETIAEVRRYLRRIDLVAARDATSAARLAELGAATPRVMGDLALEALEPVVPRPSGRGAGPRVGVAMREIRGRGPSIAPDAAETLGRELATALDRLVADTGARIELIPFRTRVRPSQPDDDARAGEALASVARTGATWIRHAAPADAAAFGALAAGLDLVIGIRLHALVLGAAAGRPILGVAYDPKVSGFLSDLGLPGQSLPLDASAADLVAVIERSLADPALVDRVRSGVAVARARTRALEPAIAELAVRHRWPGENPRRAAG